MRIRLSLEYWNNPYPPPCLLQGRPPILIQFHRHQLKGLLIGKPNTYLEEMRLILYDDFNASVSLSTIWRALEQMDWSRRVATKVAAEGSYFWSFDCFLRVVFFIKLNK